MFSWWRYLLALWTEINFFLVGLPYLIWCLVKFLWPRANWMDEYERRTFFFSLGELLTTAQWIRRFVDEHPDYKKDSVISDTISYDLLNTFDRISRGEVGAPQLFGKPTSKTSQVTCCWRNVLKIRNSCGKCKLKNKWDDSLINVNTMLN